jgi:hypothetical protein
MPSPTPRKLVRISLEWQLPAAVGCIIAAVLMTWPLAPHARDHILAAAYYWDAFTNTMIMGGHVDAVFGRGPLSLYDNYFFAPLPHTVAFNENLFGLSLLFAPFYLASGNPLLAYNATFLLSMALSVFFTYLLVRRLTSNAWGGFIAGVAFAFCPYVLFEAGRLQLTATQWIPACFLFLHRTIEERTRRDVVGLWLCYLLQIGTCLYYAMFLIPLLALVGALLLYRQRPPRDVYVTLGVGGAVASGVALAMVYPYFTSRHAFDLERSLAFASSYDGKLSFFANVHPTNLTLTGLHHLGAYRGAHEEVAFPGFVVVALALLAVAAPLVTALRKLPNPGGQLLGWGLTIATAVGLSLVTHSMLTGVVVIALVLWRRRQTKRAPLVHARELYLAALLLAVAMFLGLEPFEFRGAPVRGLYYYFHTYFPGFNGIRKVSRQAVMTTFVLVVVASHGSAWLFARAKQGWQRYTLFAALLFGTCFELRTFPHPLEPIWAAETVPEVYRFARNLPENDLIAALPQNTGTSQFRGDRGLAFHNYLMLLHGHRSPNGQSSWEPTVTTLTNRALAQLPDDAARRVLHGVGVKHLLIHGEELEAERRGLPDRLAELSQHYEHPFTAGGDHVFTLASDPDPTLELAETSALPVDARRIPSNRLRATTTLEAANAGRAIDDDPKTAWSTRRRQTRGQSFELTLSEPRPVVAFEIDNRWNQTHVPMAYELAVANGNGPWQTVAEQPLVRVPRELVYSPKTFTFRVVLATPIVASRVRLTVRQPVPGTPLTVHEARLYEASTAPVVP